MLLAALAGCGGARQAPPADSGSKAAQSTEPALKPLTFELAAYSNPRPYNPEGDKLAEAIQAELAKSGIEVKITTLPWQQYKDAVRKDGKGDAFLFGWIGDNGDPDNFLFVHFHSSQSGLNIPKYKNDKVDELLKKAQEVPAMADRSKLYADAQSLIATDAPWVFFSHMKDFTAVRSNVKNFRLHPTLSLRDFHLVEVEGKKEIIYARGADATSLDPAVIEDGESAKVVNLVYDTLVRYKNGSTEVEPWLAESWEISPDGKTYTFKLRKGVKFHDGSEFNAEAVKYSIDRQLTPEAKQNWPYADFTFGGVKEVKVVDPHTVQIILNAPNAPFLANLAMSLAAPVISPAAHKQAGDQKFGTQPSGTGPFMLEKWDKDQQIVLKANPNYWGGKPKLERVIFKVTAKNEVRADEILAGQVDIMDGIANADVERIRKGSGIQMLEQDGMNISYMGLRTDRPPFNDPRVRQAVSMLINREAIVKALYRGNANVANGALPAWMPGHAAGVKPLAYDPVKAKSLLREAGYQTK